jgi:N4-gp56 family major capsid protein
MNVTAARPGLTPIIWDSDYFTEYVRNNQFSRYFGTSDSSMIQLKDDLTRKNGDTVVFPAVRRLIGAGVTGNTVLEGNEEILNARSLNVVVSLFRHAVAVSEWDEQKSVIDLRNAARDALLVWDKEKMRNDIIFSLGAITADGNVQVNYGAATAAQRNAWMVNNADRVLFGHQIANAVSGVMATALLTIANPGDKMTAAMLSLAKRRARMASPHIRPIRVNDDEEWFVVFLGSLAFRDLRADPVIIQSLQQGWTRGENNPLFSSGDLIWDGMVIREIPELGVIAGAGAGGIDVSQNYLCGAQALGIAWAQRARSTTNVRDYDFFHGVGIQEIRGIAKLRWGVDPTVDQTKPVDAGIVSIFAAGVADS